MQRMNFLVLLSVTTLLFACADPDRLTEASAREAVNRYLSAANAVTCRDGRSLQAALNSSYSTWKLTKLMKPSNAQGSESAPVHFLHQDLLDAGVVEMVVTPGLLGNEDTPRLKSSGRDIRLLKGGGFEVPHLCAGEFAVDKVIKWTEPAASGGVRTSVVTFTIRTDQLAAWAKGSSLQRLFLPKQFSPDTEHQVRLQKTNIGWEAMN